MRQKFEIQETHLSKLGNILKILAHFFRKQHLRIHHSNQMPNKSSTHSTRNPVFISTQTGADIVSCRWVSDGWFRDAPASVVSAARPVSRGSRFGAAADVSGSALSR